MKNLKKLLSITISAAMLSAFAVPMAHAEATVYEEVVYSYDKTVNGTDYGSLTNLLGSGSISATQEKGLSITSPEYKRWAGIKLGDMGTNALHIEATLDVSDGNNGNLFLALVNPETASTHLEALQAQHITNVFYNVTDASTPGTTGTNVYALSGANYGWTNSGKGDNGATINNKSHTMKTIASYENPNKEDIKLDLTLTYQGWTGSISVGENTTYIDYMAYSYAIGKSWYTMWNTPTYLALTTKYANSTNIFKSLKVSKQPYASAVVNNGKIHTTLDTAALANAQIKDFDGNSVSFEAAPQSETSDYTNKTLTLNTSTVVTGSVISLSDADEEKTYILTVPKDSVNGQGIALKEDFIYTFKLSEENGVNLFAFDKNNTIKSYLPAGGSNTQAWNGLNENNKFVLNKDGNIEAYFNSTSTNHYIAFPLAHFKDSTKGISNDIIKVDFEVIPQPNEMSFTMGFRTGTNTDNFDKTNHYMSTFLRGTNKVADNNYSVTYTSDRKLNITPFFVNSKTEGSYASTVKGTLFIYPDHYDGIFTYNGITTVFKNRSHYDWANAAKINHIADSNYIFLNRLTASTNTLVFNKLELSQIANPTVTADYDIETEKLTFITDTVLADNSSITVNDGTKNLDTTSEVYKVTETRNVTSSVTGDYDVTYGTKIVVDLSDEELADEYTLKFPALTTTVSGSVFANDVVYTWENSKAKITSAGYDSESKTVSAAYSYNGEIPTVGGYTAILAAYNADGSLISASVSPNLVEKGRTLTLQSDSKPDHIKVFIWDSIDTLKPLYSEGLEYKF